VLALLGIEWDWWSSLGDGRIVNRDGGGMEWIRRAGRYGRDKNPYLELEFDVIGLKMDDRFTILH
jgi:hypothetical protein